MKPANLKHAALAVLLPALLFTATAGADTLNVAVAANLKAAFSELAADFQRVHPGDIVEPNFGSSGKFAAQIANGAPFEMFFSADTDFPRKLADQGLVAGEPRVYAIGHLVLWSLDRERGTLPLKQLPAAIKGKLAIANPATAPYGLRAQEALQHEGVLEALQPKLVLGENITQTAQFVDTGAADAGIIALAQVLGPELRDKGSWTRIPDDWHQPLEQAYAILKPGADKRLPKAFADYMATPPARAILERYGYDTPQ
jgi:molybdate transport system substrate-binding protein